MLTCNFLETSRGVTKGVEVIPLEFFFGTLFVFFFLCTVNHITNRVSLLLERVCIQEGGSVPPATHRVGNLSDGTGTRQCLRSPAPSSTSATEVLIVLAQCFEPLVSLFPCW